MDFVSGGTEKSGRCRKVAVSGGSTVFAPIEHRYHYDCLSPRLFTFKVYNHRSYQSKKTKVEASRSKLADHALHSINTDYGRKRKMKSYADVVL